MIKFERFILDNGLKVLVHEDHSTPLVAMNILYNVGSRDEDPGMTGVAHLFEHLMFGGSVSIPEYDRHLQKVGGENNAFTSNDITNYYLTVPAENIETGFWLESDRMLGLDFSEKNLAIQKNVVIEEFNQRYLNQPYGDAILRLRPLAYKVHPYRWPAIGMDVSHIANARLEDIRKFFFSHYAPNNAVLSLSGHICSDDAIRLAEKWFGPVPERNVSVRNLPSEPEQTEARALTLEKDVPTEAIYKVWHTCPRNSPDYFTLDLITDLLAGGESGRLYTRLVRDIKLFSEINAYITSDMDPGLLILHGKLMKETGMDAAENAINELIEELINGVADEDEMEKVKNKFEASSVFSYTSILNKAVSLAQYELMGNPELINIEVRKYRNTSGEMAREAAGRYLKTINCSTLYYISSRNHRPS
jgi:zinc protease